MVRYLIDVNLPYRFSYWRGPKFLHQRDLDERWKYGLIWEYARHHDLTIITKDKDFAERMRVSEPPPRVIWLRCGNCSLRELYVFLEPHWQQALAFSAGSQLVSIENIGVISV